MKTGWRGNFFEAAGAGLDLIHRLPSDLNFSLLCAASLLAFVCSLLHNILLRAQCVETKGVESMFLPGRCWVRFEYTNRPADDWKAGDLPRSFPGFASW